MYGLTADDLDFIRSTLQQFPDVEEVILYGSRAKGNYKPGSDIDLALKGNQLTAESVTAIWGILNDDSPLPYSFDITDYEAITNTDLKEHIDRVGALIYSKN